MTQRSGVSCSAMPAIRQVSIRRHAGGELARRKMRRATTGTSASTPSAASATSSVGVSTSRQIEIDACNRCGRRQGRRRIGSPARRSRCRGRRRTPRRPTSPADADGGRGDEGREPHAEQRRREIDQPERKHRHQPQEQQIAERIGAKAVRELRRERTGAPRQAFAARAARDQEDDASRRRARRRSPRWLPTTGPNRRPPVTVRIAPPGSESATTAI